MFLTQQVAGENLQKCFVSLSREISPLRFSALPPFPAWKILPSRWSLRVWTEVRALIESAVCPMLSLWYWMWLPAALAPYVTDTTCRNHLLVSNVSVSVVLVEKIPCYARLSGKKRGDLDFYSPDLSSCDWFFGQTWNLFVVRIF